MSDPKKAFFAYVGGLHEVVPSIRSAIQTYNQYQKAVCLESWEKNDISGVPLAEPIFGKISLCNYLAADITYLNENVAFEVGYAIGQRKRCLLFRNTSLEGEREQVTLPPETSPL